IAMRYIEGETLAKRIASTRAGTVVDTPLTIVDLDEIGLDDDPDTLVLRGMASSGSQNRSDVMRMVYLIEKIARALHAVHEAGVIHRDVKPGNVMITPEGDAVVMDFGLARDEESDLQTLTRSGDLFGTPAYMSPEQLTSQGIRPDRRTDVWSLGVMLYECVTLKRPFEAPSREGLYRQILATEPEDPRRLNPSIPRDLATIIATALEKERDRRYQTALDLAEDLRRVRSYEPTVASPVGPVTRLVRWSQRNPAVAAALVVVLLSLSAGLFISLWQKSLADNAREDAETESARAETALDGLQVEQASTKAALREAEEARLRATEALTHAEAVKDFLNDDVLGQVSPEDGNKDVLVRDILDKAARNIEGKFDESPLIEADIRSTIGDTYRHLGRFALAQPHAERALDLRREHLGEEHPGTLAAMNNLGALHKAQGKYDLALRFYEKVLDVRQRALGEDHPNTLSAMNNLGALYKAQGKYGLALPLFEKALEGERRVLGEEHPDTLLSMNNLGSLYSDKGRYNLARPLLEKALEVQRRVQGED
ncbi:MAG: serine/threonine-protein kinase, partial [Myxococcota bacterium]